MYRKLERKFGRYAIKDLMRYVIILYAAGYIINLINSDFYSNWLMLDIDKLLHGQIWRLITFIIQPTGSNILMTALMLYVYYSIGRALEQTWGTFRFNYFYFTGILFNILAVVLIYLYSFIRFGHGISYPVPLDYLNMSLFLAFAVTYPEMRFYLMFLIPVKAKYLAIAYGIFFLYDIYSAFSYSSFYGVCMAIMITVSMGNFLLYFFSIHREMSPSSIGRKVRFRRSYNSGANIRHNTINPERHSSNGVITRHKCAVCGRTELDGANLEFRFCSKCNGNYEYCQDHLFTHEHVK